MPSVVLSNSTVVVSGGVLAVGTVPTSSLDSEVYTLGAADFTATSAKIYLDNSAPSSSVGAPGDLWFRY